AEPGRRGDGAGRLARPLPGAAGLGEGGAGGRGGGARPRRAAPPDRQGRGRRGGARHRSRLRRGRHRARRRRDGREGRPAPPQGEPARARRPDRQRDRVRQPRGPGRGALGAPQLQARGRRAVRLELHLTQRPELRLQLSPQLIQRIEILQLGAQDLEDMVENELASNEALVAEKPTPKELEPQPAEVGQKQDESAAEANPADSEPRVELEVWDDTYRTRIRARGGDDDEDPKQQALNNTPSRARTLAEHLEDQLQLTDATERIQRLARFIIENLDRNGWLKVPLAEIVVP